jgi:hypothetical protein
MNSKNPESSSNTCKMKEMKRMVHVG